MARASITVNPDGATVMVDITKDGQGATVYAASSGGSPLSLPYGVSSVTPFYVERPPGLWASDLYVVSASLNGTEFHSETVRVTFESAYDPTVKIQLSEFSMGELTASMGWLLLSQAEYDALDPPNADTLYVVVG